VSRRLISTERRAAGAARTGDDHPVFEHNHLRRELARQARVGNDALPAGECGSDIGMLVEPGRWDALIYALNNESHERTGCCTSTAS
jgi:hypothetical protein